MMNAVQTAYRLPGSAFWPAVTARAEGSAITW